MIASAAAIAIAFITAFAFLNPKEDAQNTASNSNQSSDTVARLIASVDAVWQDAAPAPGSSLPPGSYSLEQGSADLKFDEGARITLRGPARFNLKSANHLHLLSGKMVAYIPEDALGFAVTTPQSEIVDLGTEFGLDVVADGRTDIHVMDGLVEVYSRNASSDTEKILQTGIKIEEGQARRLESADALRLQDIPFFTREQILGNRRFENLGLSLLRGSVKVRNDFATQDIYETISEQSRIEVIPESEGVLLEQDAVVTFTEPGKYRFFGPTGKTIPAGTKVDSFLLHFRSDEMKIIRGVIKFDRPILGLICESDQLAATDALVGLASVDYPSASYSFRSLEPHNYKQVSNLPAYDTGGGLSADEVTLSQDMTTLGLHVNVIPNEGMDQLRVLVLSKD